MQDVLNEKLTLVAANISTFSGYKRATRADIAALGGSLPVSDAITEGSIKVFPTGNPLKNQANGSNLPLAEMQTTRRNLFRKLQQKGVKALGSSNVFAILTEDLPEIEREIAEAEIEFDAQLAKLDQDYDQIFEDHVQRNLKAEAILRRLKVDRITALSKCHFSKDVFRIAPFVREGETEEQGVEGIIRGLGRQLYEEVAASMAKLLENDAFEKQRVGQKTLRPLKEATKKLKKLSFLDPTVEGAISLVDDTLKQLPQNGYIEGQHFVTLEKLVEAMSDTDTLINAASRVKNGLAVADVLFPPVVAPVVPVAEVAEVVETVPVAVSAQPEEVPVAEVAPVVPVATVVPVVSAVAVMLPPVTLPKPSGLSSLSGLSQLPALKPRDALKSNSLMF